MNLTLPAPSRTAIFGLALALTILTACDGTSSPSNSSTNRSPSTFSSTVAKSDEGNARPSGILYLRTKQGDSASRPSTTLRALDPATGSTTVVREFVHPTDVAPSIDTNKAIRARNGFSPDLQRMAATKTVGTDNHVGWIDAANTFIDISAHNASTNSFANKPQDTSPTFDATGAFYYLDLVAKAVMRVPAGAKNAELVRTETFTPTGILRDNPKLYVSPPPGPSASLAQADNTSTPSATRSVPAANSSMTGSAVTPSSRRRRRPRSATRSTDAQQPRRNERTCSIALTHR
ncbi:hypothetical protein [Nocardia salmonicida]|uniref:hypothetical protein n=1 Tax=Nocardia salmonicida TaxID=53431 RepID=UPI0033CEB3AC